jgi:ubiquinone biosynthesis protein UbiJ
LLPGREDRWWAVDADTDVAELADALTEAIVDYAIPVLVRYSSEEQLRDLWLSGQASNLTDVQRLMHLSVLLDAIGPREELQKVVGELSAVSAGRPTAGVVQRHLERLQESRPN